MTFKSYDNAKVYAILTSTAESFTFLFMNMLKGPDCTTPALDQMSNLFEQSWSTARILVRKVPPIGDLET